MNFLHLKYAFEIAQAKSISKAAEKLYVSQPVLSKAIRELEDDIGFAIFTRTSKGVVPTKSGSDFLVHARKILDDVEEVEALYKVTAHQEYRFDVTVPIACYIAQAFVEFMKELSGRDRVRVDYLEANSMTAIDRVVGHDSNIGIIRYENQYADYFLRHIESKDLVSKEIWQFEYRLIMSRSNPLAQKDLVRSEDLESLLEISHGDPLIPSLPASVMTEMKRREASAREIVVYERQSQFELLCEIPRTYMWASPTPQNILDNFSLVQKRCDAEHIRYTDALIYRKGYRLTGEDRTFLQKVEEQVERLQQQSAP